MCAHSKWARLFSALCRRAAGCTHTGGGGRRGDNKARLLLLLLLAPSLFISSSIHVRVRPSFPSKKRNGKSLLWRTFFVAWDAAFSHPPLFHVVAEKRGKEAFSFPFLVPFYSPPFSLCRFMVVGFLCRSPSPPTEMRLGIRETRKGRGGMEGAEDQSG